MLFEVFAEPFVEFAFMRRALVGCVALSLGAPPLGVFLMLRRMSMTGDAMAHAILPGVAIGFLIAGLSLPAMTIGGIVAGLAVAFCSGIVARTTPLKEEASLAAFYLISLAAGVLLVSMRGSNVDLMHMLFGTVLALDAPAIGLMAGIASTTLLVLAVVLRGLVAECLDSGYFRSVSRAGASLHMVFLALVVLNLVGGFQALGTLMAVGIMMLPALTARFWVREVTGLMLVAVLVGIASGVMGLLASYHWNVPSGPAIVLAAGALYVVSLVAGPVDSLTSRWWPLRHLEA
jgi:zinc/manganese transport system permease protein